MDCKPKKLNIANKKDLITKIVNGTAFTPTGCWEWQGTKKGSGHGKIHVGNSRYLYVHRVAYKLFVDPDFDESLDVLHKCHNPPCISPDHLYAGTHQDNMTDRKNSGRTFRFHKEEHPEARLTQKQVDQIRKEYVPRKNPIRKLAKKYGVTYNTIWQILNYVTWKD